LTVTTPSPVARTLTPTFSFYVPSSDRLLIEACSMTADGVVVHGVNGPAVVAAMRRDGFEATVLFDRAGYERRTKATAASAWFDAQFAAGADRVLTAGRWVEWDLAGDALARAVDAVREEVGTAREVTLLFAVDSRWITTTDGLYRTIATLAQVPEPIALVLAHRDDPLGAMTAVNSLLALTRNVKDLTILRSDHGAIGAVATGAIHGSTGLLPRYRHFVPPTVTSGGRVMDRTARVFVLDLMDWFTGFTIAGWGATGVDLNCKLACCGGQSLTRFLDERLSADDHNRVVLGWLAAHVLDAEPMDRLGEFSQLCTRALGHYGPMGKLSDVTVPKSQLEQWAQFPPPQLR
jgi:hypothetical protein